MGKLKNSIIKIIKVKDKNNFSISTKLDIGVHKKFDIKQDKYCFNLEAINESVTLIINSKEQIIGEKLKSLLKFGIRTTRFKDVFDIYYLLNNTNINKTELLSIINSLIINDSLMRENDIDEVASNLETILNNNIFKRNLSIVKNNWLELSVDKVVDNVIKYFNELKTSLVP